MAHRYLITGANGFLGRRLLEEAAARGLRGTAVILPGTEPVTVPGWETVPLALADGPELRALVARSRVVIHLAGNMLGASPARFRQANAGTVRELLKAVAAVPEPPRLVQASSVAAVGPSRDGTPLDEAAPARPVCLYGRTKREGERSILGSAVAGRSLVMRLCSVYGPGDRCFLDLFRMAERGLFLRLATRNKRFQLSFVDDLVDVIWRLADDRAATGVLNVGDPAVLTDVDLQDALGRAAGKNLRSVFVPGGATRLMGRLYDLIEACTNSPNLMSSGKASEMSQPAWLQDFSAQMRLLPGLRWTPLADGIDATRRWYLRQGWL